jgi:hypothetical protein
MERKSTSANYKIPVRPSTRKKFDAAAKNTRRKLVDVADMAVDLYLQSQQQPAMSATSR